MIVCDNGNPFLCDTVKVFYTVLTTNAPPLANDNFITALTGMTTTANVLLNDSDPNIGQTLTPSVLTAPKHVSSFTLSPNGDYAYTPLVNFVGSDTVIYKVCDNGVPSMCDTAYLTDEMRGLLVREMAKFPTLTVK